MKKIFLFPLVSAMSFLLVACGEKEPSREEVAAKERNQHLVHACQIEKQINQLSDECKKILKE